MLERWSALAGAVGRKRVLSGTHRSRALQETLALLAAHRARMGITRVANVTGLDRIGLPVVMVTRPNSRSLAVSQGKGLSLQAAQASGLMESAETYYAERISLPLRLASRRELSREASVIDVNALPIRRGSIYHDDLIILWIEGFDLIQGEAVWVPYEIVHSNYTVPFPTGNGCFAQSTNGLASGNELLEAISHGVCEVVERDASALFAGRDRASEAKLDLDTVPDSDCRSVIAMFEAAGVAVSVWDITTDTAIATFHCEISDSVAHDAPFLRRAAGVGCHLDRSVALLRALTEAAQSRLTIIAGSRDDMPREGYDSLLDVRAALPECSGFGLHFQQAPSWATETLHDDVELQLDRLVRIGVQRCIAIDLSRPEFPFAIARIVIPGLEGPHKIDGVLPGVRARSNVGVA